MRESRFDASIEQLSAHYSDRIANSERDSHHYTVEEDSARSCEKLARLVPREHAARASAHGISLARGNAQVHLAAFA